MAACGQRDDKTRRQTRPPILLRGNGPDPDSLDPHKARSTESMVVLRDLFEGLTRLDKNAATIPAAAESWTVSDDGRVYTFKLRPNLRWSNGDPLVAEDFVAGLRRLVDPATASQYAQVVDVILNAPDIVAGKKPVDALGVAAPDATTVVITLQHARRPIYRASWRIRRPRRCIGRRSRNSASGSRARATRCRTARSCSRSGCRAATSAPSAIRTTGTTRPTRSTA